MLHVLKDDFDKNSDDILKSINKMLQEKEEKKKDKDKEKEKQKEENK